MDSKEQDTSLQFVGCKSSTQLFKHAVGAPLFAAVGLVAQVGVPGLHHRASAMQAQTSSIWGWNKHQCQAC